jgi:hypothetical protein
VDGRYMIPTFILIMNILEMIWWVSVVPQCVEAAVATIITIIIMNIVEMAGVPILLYLALFSQPLGPIDHLNKRFRFFCYRFLTILAG